MRRGTVRSELIRTIGHGSVASHHDVLEIEYRDGKLFRYFNVPYGVARRIIFSRHPGTDWLRVRDQYRFEEVKK